MKKDLAQLKEDFERDKAYNQDTRQEAQDLLHFYYISHYTDEWRNALPLKFQGQFDTIKKAGRKIISDLSSQDIQADFAPKDGTDPSLSNIMDRLFRTDARKNSSIEAFYNATLEQVPCGIGGWRLVNEWESDKIGDRNQTINRIPIHEFNSCVFWDSAARMQDKSDAKRCHIVSGYNKEDYEELKEELTGQDDDECEGETGPAPVTSYGAMVENGKDVYIVESYYREKVSQVVEFYRDDEGKVYAYEKAEAKKFEATLAEEGKTFFDRKTIKVWKVKKYTWTDTEILSESDVVGPNIPVVPQYGERVFVNGIEHYEGITRGAKDAARLRDFMYSYMADIATSSPRETPIFFAEQIEGLEWQYQENGVDGALPYRTMNRVAADGAQLPVGPIATLPPPQLPPALIAAMQGINESLSESTSSGAPNTIADVSMSGTAVSQVRAMLDENSIIFRNGAKIAKRRDAEIWLGMAPEVYGVKRKVTLTNKDGTTTEEWLQETEYDLETGEERVINNLAEADFDLAVDIGESFGSQRQQSRQEVGNILQSLQPGSKEYMMLLHKYLELTDGEATIDIRKYSHKQLLLMGIREAETEEDIKALEQAQAEQGQQADPALELAKAEQMKAQNGAEKLKIDMYNAETNRMKVMQDAAKINADIENLHTKTAGNHIDNVQKAYGGR
jgi:hypothetical protein